MRRLLLAASVLPLWNLAAAASAHPNHNIPHTHFTDGGLFAGVLHPLLGIDHLLAMLAVGLLATQFVGWGKWLVPGSFVGGLVAGGVLGMTGISFGYAEFGIAISLIALGCALAVGKRLQLIAVLLAAAMFGFAHGHAHGMEVPSLAFPIVYALGFTVTTIILHAAGVAVGLFARQSTIGATSLRASGIAVAALGMFLLAVM